jgi:predicted nucleotidyltransferase
LELDILAEENEGATRSERLILMRKIALSIMKLLKAFCPLLIGSVWRGTIKRGSDIDIEVYSDKPEELMPLLRKAKLEKLRTKMMTVNTHGKTEASFHIHAESLNECFVEIVVRSLDEKGRKRECDFFGDEIKGLSIQELEKLLKENAGKRFLPS